MKKDEENLLTMNKNKITDMLDRRHKDRKLHLDTMQNLKLRDSAATENYDYFKDSFLERYRELEFNLLNIQSTQDNNTIDLSTKFNKISASIQELQAYLSSSTLFLPESTVKMCQRRIEQLLMQFEDVKLKLMPKKKFGFRKKPVIVTDNAASVTLLKRTISNKEKDDANKLINFANHSHIDWTLQQKTNQEFILQNDEVNGKDLTMSTLTNCLIQIIGHPGSVQLSNLKNCIILCGPIARSMFADNCANCKFSFGCQQFRFHSSKNCDIYMHVTCRAIIEDCIEINVAPYTFTYSNIDIDFIKAGLDVMKNNWEDVADFNWLSTDNASPNWKQMLICDRIIDWNRVIEKYRQNIIINSDE